MECFYHSGINAVGICKSCQRALCRDCAAEQDKGIACQGRCEEDVRQLVALVRDSIRYQPTTQSIIARTRQTRVIASVFYILMGAAFIGWGLSRPFLHMVSLLGGLFVLYGLFLLTRLPKSPQPREVPPAG